MIYLNAHHIERIGADWPALVRAVTTTVDALHRGDFAQPVKPYLRYGDPANRIIAMLAFVGGDGELAGLKWIASFPANLKKGLPRAHSVTILNDAATGRPIAIINTSRVSEIRTAAVSGAVIERYLLERRPKSPLVIGIVGFGPIGRTHVEMIQALVADHVAELHVYDIAGVSNDVWPAGHTLRTVVCGSWQEVYDSADIFITATVSASRYIDRKPKPRSLHLDVSLRDYLPSIGRAFDLITVDSWDEVCRENTDVEIMHRESGLRQQDTRDLVDVFCGNAFREVGGQGTIMFNPMGMAVFDVAIGGHYARAAEATGHGKRLDEMDREERGGKSC